MEAVGFSKTFVHIYLTIKHLIPEEVILVLAALRTSNIIYCRLWGSVVVKALRY
jgi:hypothetical protein